MDPCFSYRHIQLNPIPNKEIVKSGSEDLPLVYSRSKVYSSLCCGSDYAVWVRSN